MTRFKANCKKMLNNNKKYLDLPLGVPVFFIMLPCAHIHHHIIVQIIVESVLVGYCRPQIQVMILMTGAHTRGEPHLIS